MAHALASPRRARAYGSTVPFRRVDYSDARFPTATLKSSRLMSLQPVLWIQHCERQRIIISHPIDPNIEPTIQAPTFGHKGPNLAKIFPKDQQLGTRFVGRQRRIFEMRCEIQYPLKRWREWVCIFWRLFVWVALLHMLCFKIVNWSGDVHHPHMFSAWQTLEHHLNLIRGWNVLLPQVLAMWFVHNPRLNGSECPKWNMCLECNVVDLLVSWIPQSSLTRGQEYVGTEAAGIVDLMYQSVWYRFALVASVPCEQQLQVDLLTSSMYHFYQWRRAVCDLIHLFTYSIDCAEHFGSRESVCGSCSHRCAFATSFLYLFAQFHIIRPHFFFGTARHNSIRPRLMQL